MSKSSTLCLESLLAEGNALLETIASKPFTAPPTNVTVNSPTAVDIANAIVARERNVQTFAARITGTGSQALPGVPAGARGRIVQMMRANAGISRMTIDGTAANTATAPMQINNVNQAVQDVRNVLLSAVRVSNDTSGGVTSVIWEQWP